MSPARTLSWPAAGFVFAVSMATAGDSASPAPRPRGDAAARSARSSADASTPRPDSPASTKEASTPTPAPDATAASPTFQTTVRPILATRCAPCHNPGGIMYERLPFDRAEVVSGHAEGVKRRLKGGDRQAFEAWLATLPREKGAGPS